MGVYDIKRLLDKVVDVQGSDIHIRVGRPPTLRVNARMGIMDGLKVSRTEIMVPVTVPRRTRHLEPELREHEFARPRETDRQWHRPVRDQVAECHLQPERRGNGSLLPDHQLQPAPGQGPVHDPERRNLAGRGWRPG